MGTVEPTSSNMAPPDPESPSKTPELLSSILTKCEGVIDRKDFTTCCFYASELASSSEKLRKEEKEWLKDFNSNLKEARIRDEAAMNELLDRKETNTFNAQAKYWRNNNPLITDNDVDNIYAELNFQRKNKLEENDRNQQEAEPQQDQLVMPPNIPKLSETIWTTPPTWDKQFIDAPVADNRLRRERVISPFKQPWHHEEIRPMGHPQNTAIHSNPRFFEPSGQSQMSFTNHNVPPYKPQFNDQFASGPSGYHQTNANQCHQGPQTLPSSRFQHNNQSRFQFTEPPPMRFPFANSTFRNPDIPLFGNSGPLHFNHQGGGAERSMQSLGANHWVRAGAQVVKNNEVSMAPRRFDGDKQRAFWFITDYESCALANRWNEATVINQFPNYLDNYSRHWFMSECAEGNPNLSWLDIRSAFLSYYLGTNVDDGLRELFEQLKQKEETSTQFISLAFRFARRVYPRKPTQEILRLVVKKMKYPYLNLVGQTHNSLMELNQKCADLDEIASRRSAPKKTVSFSENKPTTNNKPSDSRKKPCERCGRDNHPTEKCIAKTKLDGSPLRAISTTAATCEESEIKEESSDEDAQEYEIEHESMRDFFSSGDICSVISMPDATTEDEKGAIQSVIAVTKKGKLIKSAANNSSKFAPPMHTVTIDREHQLRAMFDSGSCRSLITYNLVKVHKLKFAPGNHELCGAGGKPLETVGTAKVNIKFTFGTESKSATVKLIVVNVLAYQLIIGVDLMVPFRIGIDLSSPARIYFSGERNGISLIEPIKLPPRSQTIVACAISKHNPPETVMVKPFNFKPNVFTAYSVSTVEANFVQCLMLNLNNEAVEIDAGTQVAGLEYLDTIGATTTTQKESIAAVKEFKISEHEVVKVGDNLSDVQIRELLKLITQHIDAFSINGQLGSTTVVEHDIELLPNARPHAEPLRRRPFAHIIETRRQIQSMLDTGIIEPSESAWAAAYVVVSKKTGDLRICLDFRKLNSFTKKCSYPLPNVDDCLDRLAGNCFFSNLDLASGFWQLPLSERAKELTAFRTEDGHFQFRKMPFGLVNAPASFQKLVNLVFAGIKGMNMQVFIDDLCIATPTWEEHLKMLEKVFVLLIESGLKLKASKCNFGADNVVFLGHKLDKDGIRADPSKLEAIRKLPKPKSVDDVRRVHGLLNYYRKMVPNFAELAAPFTRLLKKNAQFHWGQEQNDAFNKIREILTRDPILAHYHYNKEVILKTDASLVGLAGILTQRKDNDWVIVACCSRNTNDAEKNYSTTELEALAMVYAIDKFRHYLLGRHFVVLTDHCALCALNLRTPKNSRLQRWKWVLQEFDFEIRYVRGEAHQDVDCLSRAPVVSAYDNYLDEKVLVTLPTKATANIVTPLDVTNWKVLSEADEEATEHYTKARARAKGYKLTSGLLYYEDKLFVPKPLREQILSEAHEGLPSGHGGVRQTLNRLTNYWWPNMAQEARSYIQSCDNCQRNKIQRQLPSGEMFSIEATAPLDLFAFDTIGPLAVSVAKTKHILVGVDVFSKYVTLSPLLDVQGSSIAKEIKKIIGYVGIPRAILTDNAPSFANREMRDLQFQFKFDHKFSTARHHQGNSVAERAIQSVEQKLLAFTHDPAHSVDWDEELPNVMLSINTATHVTTGFTPYRLLFGLDANEPSELVSFQNAQSKFDKMKTSDLQRDRITALETTMDAQLRSKKYFNRLHKPRSYAVGEFVLIKTGEGRMSKLQSPFEGPYQILDKARDIYTLKQVGGKEKTVNRHVSNIRPYIISESEPEAADGETSKEASFYESLGDESLNRSQVEQPATVNTITVNRVVTTKVNPTSKKMLFFKAIILILAFNWTNDTANGFFEPERANPLIWTDTKKIVAPAPYDYNFFYRLGNPCYKLWEILDIPRYVVNEAVKHCELIFINQITHKLDRIARQQNQYQVVPNVTPNQLKPPNTQEVRKQTNVIVKRNIESTNSTRSMKKRQIFAAGVISGYVVSNVWKNLFYNPGPSPTADLKLKIKTADIKLQELNALENITQTQVRAMHEMVKLQGQLIEHNVESLEHVRFEQASLTVLVSDVVSRIYLLSALLDRISITFRGSNPDLAALLQLLDTPETRRIMADITPRSIDLPSIKLSVFDALTLQINFRAHPQSHEAKVNRVIAFKHYGNLLNNATLYEYHGPTYVMYNFTNNCIRGITEPIDEDYIELECNESDGEDPSLSEWRASNHGVDLSNPIHTAVYTVYPNTYAYCYPRNITIGGRTRACPPNVFFLDSRISWNTSDYKYSPKRINFNATIVTNVHPAHYRNFSHYFDSNEALEKIHHMQRTSEETFQRLIQEREMVKRNASEVLDSLKQQAYFSVGSYNIEYRMVVVILFATFGLQMLIFVVRWYLVLRGLKKEKRAKAARDRYRSARSHSDGFYGYQQAIPLSSRHARN